MATIGERIKKRRLELGMSQDELARIMGYKSRSSINKLERQGQDLPIKRVKQIAEALQTTPEYIMGWEEKPEGKKPVKITFSKEASENFNKVVQSLADSISPTIKASLNDSKIFEAILKVMAELGKDDQDKVLNYANTLKENKSYREYIESIQKHKKR